MRELPDGTKNFVAGRSSNEKLGALLPTLRSLPQTRVVQYPAEFCAKEKGDLNDFFLAYSQEDFVALLTSALDPDDVEVRCISPNLSAQERAQKLEEFARNMVNPVINRTPIETNALVNHLARHLKLSKEEVKYIRERMGALRASGVAREDSAELSTKYRKIYPGIDYFDCVLFYTVSRRTMIQKHV